MDHWITQLPAQSVWFGIGLLVAAAVAVLMAGRLRLNRVDVLGLLSTCIVGAGVGSRIFWALLDPTVAIPELSSNPLGFIDPLAPGHSSFGAMVGGGAVLLGWWVLSRQNLVSRLSSSDASGNGPQSAKLNTLDALVLAGLSGLGLARVGCLSNGCDFGRLTDVPWALHYGPGTAAYMQHLKSGLIAWGAPESLGVHPFALYLSLGVLIITLTGTAMLWTRRVPPGRVGLGCGMGYLVVRFLVEWARDPATVLEIWAGFNVHHLLAILGVLLCIAAIALQQHRRRANGHRHCGV